MAASNGRTAACACSSAGAIEFRDIILSRSSRFLRCRDRGRAAAGCTVSMPKGGSFHRRRLRHRGLAAHTGRCVDRSTAGFADRTPDCSFWLRIVSLICSTLGTAAKALVIVNQFNVMLLSNHARCLGCPRNGRHWSLSRSRNRQHGRGVAQAAVRNGVGRSFRSWR